MNESRRYGVIFDVDGVLVDSAQAHYRSWQELSTQLNQTISRQRFDATFGRQNRDVIPDLFGVHDESEIQILSERKEAVYRELIRLDPPIAEGVVPLIRQLAELGVSLAVGSSGPRMNVELVLEAMGIRSLFRAVICGEDVQRGKPHPEVFQLGAERMGLDVSSCVVIEDSPAGVEAAKAAGMAAVAILAYHPLDAFDHVDLHVNTMIDLTSDKLLEVIDTHRSAHRK